MRAQSFLSNQRNVLLNKKIRKNQMGEIISVLVKVDELDEEVLPFERTAWREVAAIFAACCQVRQFSRA